MDVDPDKAKENIEEVEAKDIKFSPVEGVVANHVKDHDSTVVRELDTAFFAAIEAVVGADIVKISLTKSYAFPSGSYGEFARVGSVLVKVAEAV